MIRNWFVQNGGWESQGLQPASRRPGRANGVSSSRSLSPKVREDWRPSSKTRLAEREQILPSILSLLFYSSLQGIGWDPPTPRRAICFTQSPNSNADLTRNTLTDTPRIVFNQISGHSVAQSTWHIKLIIAAAKRHRRILNNWEKKDLCGKPWYLKDVSSQFICKLNTIPIKIWTGFLGSW